MNSTLTFPRLLELLKECEVRLINEENNAIYSTYANYLKGDKKFVADSVKLLREFDIFTSVSAEGGCDYPSEEPSLLELMLYAYLLPYGKNKSYEAGMLPDFFDDDSWEGFYYNKARLKKYYYLDRLDATEQKCATIDIKKYVDKYYMHLSLFYGGSKEDIIDGIIKKTRTDWIISSSKDGEFFGLPLCCFPFISDTSGVVKRNLFLIDLGCYVFRHLVELRMKGEEAPLIIPQDFLTSQIVSFTKSMIKPDIDFNPTDGSLEIKSDVYHTVFDVISLADELSGIEDEGVQQEIITTAISEIKKENTTFPNVTVRDLSGLSNIIGMFISKDPDAITLDTTLGELCDGTLRGIGSNRNMSQGRRRDTICDALSILHKWSTYNFNLGVKGSVTPFNYIADEYATSPGALRQAIMGMQGQARIGVGEENKKSTVLALQDMSAHELEKMPIRIEMSVFIKEIIEHNQMSRQFSRTYDSLENQNTKAVYAFIEMKRKEKKYPADLRIYYTDLASSFIVDRKIRFIEMFKQCLMELCAVGVIKDCIFYDKTISWKLSFEKIM